MITRYGTAKCKVVKIGCWWHTGKSSSRLEEVWKTADFSMLVMELVNSIASLPWQKNLEEEAGRMPHQYRY